MKTTCAFSKRTRRFYPLIIYLIINTLQQMQQFQTNYIIRRVIDTNPCAIILVKQGIISYVMV